MLYLRPALMKKLKKAILQQQTVSAESVPGTCFLLHRFSQRKQDSHFKPALISGNFIGWPRAVKEFSTMNHIKVEGSKIY